jgi:hypothetical protein
MKQLPSVKTITLGITIGVLNIYEIRVKVRVRIIVRVRVRIRIRD